MNTIIVDRDIVDKESEQYLDMNLSDMIVECFVFPNVKIKLKEDNRDKTFKLKLIDGTRKFECRYFTTLPEYNYANISVGFRCEWDARNKRFMYHSLTEKDLYAFEVLNTMGYVTDSFRRKRWQDIVSTLGKSVIAICYIIMNHDPEIIVRDAPSEKTIPKERIIRPKADGNKTYLFRDIVKYVNHQKQKEKHNITCECWGVRGHYRHYKNGNVTFIHEYQKGKKRNESAANDKTYVWK